MTHILALLVALGVALYLSNQVRKPTRYVGRLFARLMNRSHGRLTDWGLGQFTIQPTFVILDVGCGGGKTIQKLVALASEGMVYGVDYADGSVAVARATNAAAIEAGRVEIQIGRVSELPFNDGTFDLVTAIETHYYWPDIGRDLLEIRRVLKPGGTVAIIAESYSGGRFDRIQKPFTALFRIKGLTVAGHRELFESAGYAGIRVLEERGKGWICAMGTKPVIPT